MASTKRVRYKIGNVTEDRNSSGELIGHRRIDEAPGDGGHVFYRFCVRPPGGAWQFVAWSGV